ncbi:ribosome-binding factor A [Achromatium sp. WMS2]|nr:ribosome-binding factor A [Achromatium sp. WMS2]
MREFQRADRLGAELRRELASILQGAVRDPRLGTVTIQEVKLAKNFAYAKVFFTCSNADIQATSKLLNKVMAGFLRHELAQRTRIRAVPALHFVYDESVVRGSYVTDLINKAISAEPSPLNEIGNNDSAS